MTQCCSLLVLCCGGVAALSAIAAVAIATATDHWTHVAVDRHAVAEHVPQPGPEQRFYSRHLGLFRVCFPDQEARPALGSPGLYLNSVEVWCYGRDYRLEELLRGVLRPANTSHYGEARLQLARAAPCLLVLYLLLMAVTGLLGLVGCWAQAASKLITTAALQLLAALLGACAMAAWHAALFLEMEKVHEAGSPLTWPGWLQEATTVGVGWSYFVAWAGMCLTLVASLATSAAAICLRAERRTWEQNTARLKLRMSSMLAINRYYPGHHETAADKAVKSVSPMPLYPPGYVPQEPSNHPVATMNPLDPLGAHYSRSLQSRSRSQSRASLYSAASRDNLAEHAPDLNTFVDYKKVVGQLENSKFY